MHSATVMTFTDLVGLAPNIYVISDCMLLRTGNVLMSMGKRQDSSCDIGMTAWYDAHGIIISSKTCTTSHPRLSSVQNCRVSCVCKGCCLSRADWCLQKLDLPILVNSTPLP